MLLNFARRILENLKTNLRRSNRVRKLGKPNRSKATKSDSCIFRSTCGMFPGKDKYPLETKFSTTKASTLVTGVSTVVSPRCYNVRYRSIRFLLIPKSGMRSHLGKTDQICEWEVARLWRTLSQPTRSDKTRILQNGVGIPHIVSWHH